MSPQNSLGLSEIDVDRIANYQERAVERSSIHPEPMTFAVAYVVKFFSFVGLAVYRFVD